VYSPFSYRYSPMLQPIRQMSISVSCFAYLRSDQVIAYVYFPAVAPPDASVAIGDAVKVTAPMNTDVMASFREMIGSLINVG
jgi:hypothetical protein